MIALALCCGVASGCARTPKAELGRVERETARATVGGPALKTAGVGAVGAELAQNANGEPPTLSSLAYVELGRYPQTVAKRKAVRAIKDRKIAPIDNVYSLNAECAPDLDEEYYGDYVRIISGMASMYKGARPEVNRNNYTFSDGTGIMDNSEYFFKIEPIKWRVFVNEKAIANNAIYLIADKILDHTPFLDSAMYKYSKKQECYAQIDEADNELSIKANDYAGSELRRWLNDDFCERAFKTVTNTLKVTEIQPTDPERMIVENRILRGLNDRTARTLTIPPNTIDRIGPNAFDDCYDLKTICYQGDNWDKLKKDDNWNGGRELRVLTPKNRVKISDLEPTAMSKMQISDGVLTGLTDKTLRTLTIPAHSIGKIAPNAFKGCESLERVCCQGNDAALLIDEDWTSGLERDIPIVPPKSDEKGKIVKLGLSDAEPENADLVLTLSSAEAPAALKLLAETTDYARAHGTWMSMHPSAYGNGRWWLRDGAKTHLARYVSDHAHIPSDSGSGEAFTAIPKSGESVGAAYYGARPVIAARNRSGFIRILEDVIEEGKK